MSKLVAALLLSVAALGFAPAAHAADFVPGYQSGVNVYVDPAVKNFAPVNLDGLSDRLTELSKKHGVQYIAVYQMKDGTQTPPPQYNGLYAPWKLDGLLTQWAGQKDFPAGKAVVIMVVRSDRNLNAFALAANAGPDLKSYGVDRTYFDNPTVLGSVKDKYLPNDPTGYYVAVASNLEKSIATQDASAAFKAALPYYITGGAVLVLLLCYLGFALFRFRGIRSKLLGALVPKEKSLETVTTVSLAMRTAYLDFLTDQAGRLKKFKGKTLKQYTAALGNYTEFTLRIDLAQKLVDSARKVYDSTGFFSCLFSVGSLNKAFESLTTTAVVVTGKEVDLAKLKSVYEGLTTKTSYQPSELLENIDQLGVSTNQELGEILAAFGTADSNKRNIERILGEITNLQPQLTTAGLNFDPYSQEHTGIAAEAGTILTDIASDPLEALDDSNRISAQVNALKIRIVEALAIKAALVTTTAKVTKAKTRTDEQRNKPVIFGWVRAADEPMPDKMVHHYNLTEKGGNPDALVASAEQHLQAALAAVLAGENDKAKSEQQAAETDSAGAETVINTVLAAKEFVEKNVQPQRDALGVLNTELPPAKVALTELKTDFLAANIREVTGKVDAASTVAKKTLADIEVIRVAFYEQRFLAARELLTNLGAGIQSVRDGLVALHHRLVELRGLRSHAKDTAVEAASFSKSLVTTRRDTKFTTSAATDTRHEKLVPKVKTLGEHVVEAVADWPELSQTADALLAELHAVAQTINEERDAHALAGQRVEAVRVAVSAAGRDCNHDDVRDDARHALRDAQASLQGLQDRLETAKTDWATLARDAETKGTVAARATELAARDKQAAGEARTAISRARKKVSDADRDYGRSYDIGGSRSQYGRGTGAELSSARSSLAAANTAMNNSRYETAESEANSAYHAAERAEQAAEAAVQELITAALLVWQLEQQRLQRDAEAAAERQREREQRDRNNNSGGGGGGGGGFDTSRGNSGGTSDNDSARGSSGGTQDDGF